MWLHTCVLCSTCASEAKLYTVRLVLAQIFTRILRSLNLPVGVSQMVAPRYLTNSYDIGHLALWITALLVHTLQTLYQK